MKEITAQYKDSGEVLGELLRADDARAGLSDTFNFLCPAYPDCSARYHRVAGYDREQNTESVKPFWRKDPSSRHEPGCDYDLERKASKHRELTFFADGLYHLRINFPLGSAPGRDLYVRGHLTEKQRAAARKNADKQAAPSIEKMVRFLEKEFGSLEDDRLDELVLYYQGETQKWNDLFIGSGEYRKLLDKATRRDRKLDAFGIRPIGIIVVKPSNRSDKSDKDKSRIYCEQQDIKLRNKSTIAVTPRIILEDDSLRDKIATDRPMLVSARPFYPPEHRGRLRHRLITGEKLPDNITIDLYIARANQVSPVRSDYWHPTRKASPQQGFDFNGPPGKRPD